MSVHYRQSTLLRDRHDAPSAPPIGMPALEQCASISHCSLSYFIAVEKSKSVINKPWEGNAATAASGPACPRMEQETFPGIPFPRI